MTQLLIGAGAAIRTVEAEIDYAATSDAKVLITGESGVGKEVIARLVHGRSARVNRPLITINCASIPDTLLESALFGHVKGSFTDAARDHEGLLEQANGGTIFMDEIGEMTPRMQALLLRFLENGEIQRVGVDRVTARRVDVRVIAATNRQLADCVASNQFREDLYYRLNVIHVVVPPLRARREDIPAFLEHFLQAASNGAGAPRLAPDALDRLVAYKWPGNVRQLKNVVERLLLRRPEGTITAADLPAEIRSGAGSRPEGASPADRVFDRMVLNGESFWSAVQHPFMSRDLTRKDLERIVRRGLERTGGNYKALAALFNMPAGDVRRFQSFLRKHSCCLRT